jgi:hypothetical protein
MTLNLTEYLESIRSDARLENADETVIMNELEAHIEDKLQELTDAGLSKEEAVKTCMNQMGSTKCIARQIYEAYSQGSWRQVLLASMPHFLVGLLFFLNWWHYPGWLAMVLALVLATAVYGWFHGRPTWIFPWLGYMLLPVIVVGLTLLYIPRGWSFLALAVYFPIALWWLFRVVATTIRRDWLFSSLMLLPMPIIIGWYLAISPSGKISEESIQRLYYFAPWIGISFMALAMTIAVFLRLRQRWLRVSLLSASGLLTLTLVVCYSAGQLSNLVFLGLVAFTWAVMLIPALLERRLKRNRGTPQHQHTRGDKLFPST